MFSNAYYLCYYLLITDLKFPVNLRKENERNKLVQRKDRQKSNNTPFHTTLPQRKGIGKKFLSNPNLWGSI